MANKGQVVNRDDERRLHRWNHIRRRMNDIGIDPPIERGPWESAPRLGQNTPRDRDQLSFETRREFEYRRASMMPRDSDDVGIGVGKERLDEGVRRASRPARNGIPILFDENRSPGHPSDVTAVTPLSRRAGRRSTRWCVRGLRATAPSGTSRARTPPSRYLACVVSDRRPADRGN